MQSILFIIARTMLQLLIDQRMYLYFFMDLAMYSMISILQNHVVIAMHSILIVNMYRVSVQTGNFPQSLHLLVSVQITSNQGCVHTLIIIKALHLLSIHVYTSHQVFSSQHWFGCGRLHYFTLWVVVRLSCYM